MEHAIAITRSQLRQVIEDYIAASRVGDTLSYVETAKLSAAEAAESSTSRIWDGLHALPKVTVIHDLDQGVVNPVVHDPDEDDEIQEFVCAEDLAAGQVVIINSRGMIEGKRDEADQTVRAETRIELSRSVIDQMASMAKSITLVEDPSGFLWAETDPAVGAVPLGRPPELLAAETESPDDFF